MTRHGLVILATLAPLILSGTAAVAEDVEAGVLKGRIVDSRGTPLKGVEIVADNTLLYNSNALGVSKADGTYRIPTSAVAGTYHATARIKRKFNGKTFAFDLEPDTDDPFDGAEGAVRDFVWKLTGDYGDNRQHGSKLLFYFASYEDPQTPEAPLEQEKVEFTLTPDGPLVDGSEGQASVRRGQSTGDGFAVTDLPVARYRIEARYGADGEARRPLLVRSKGKGEFGPAVTADFEIVMSGVQYIEVEVKFP